MSREFTLAESQVQFLVSTPGFLSKLGVTYFEIILEKTMTKQDSSFSSVPQSVKDRLEELMSNPIPIELNSDGTLNIDEGLSIGDNIDLISSLIPEPPSLDGIEDEDVRKKVRNEFQVIVIRQVLGYTKDFIDRKISDGVSFSEIKQDLTELGKDVEIILSACSRKFTVQQISQQQWGKYQLRFEEVIRLESVASLRREINVRRANWESSKEYLNSSKAVKAQKEIDFQQELDEVTDTLWRILHLGVNYLTPSERLQIKVRTAEMSKKDKTSYVSGELVSLRKAYLEQWRSNPSKFTLPKVKS